MGGSSSTLKHTTTLEGHTNEVQEFEQAYSAAHPLTIKTLAGETYTLAGWGSCKDLKAALCKVVGEQLGKPSSFELLGALAPPRAAT
eukprot:gene15415-12619_t